MKPWESSCKAVLEVDLAAIQANFRTMRGLVDPAATVAAVVKSDAYGLGLLPVAKALHDAHCDFFFVANLDEATRLRCVLPDVSIAVLQDEIAHFEQIYRSERLIPVANNERDLHAIGGHAVTQRYFLNADTGFSRFGLTFAEIRRLYFAETFRSKRPYGVISHLACSDLAGDALNTLQRNRFSAVSDLLRPMIRTLSASAGVWLGRSYHFNMARVGSALYGLNNARIQPNPLLPVVRLSTKIVDVRTLSRNEAVGYGATYRTARETRLGIAAIGYTHGLPWSCANRISVRVGNFTAPVIGRISMEYVTIDLTEIPESVAGPGTWVTLLDDKFGPDDLALAAAVNAQEIITRLGNGCSKRHVSFNGAPSFAPEPAIFSRGGSAENVLVA